MDGNMEHVIIRTHAPQIDDLCCIVCELDPIEVQDSSAKSRFHWQNIKCRYFIYVAPEIIAAPIVGTDGSIFAIMRKDYYMSGVCDRVLKKLNLKFGGVCSLTTKVYKSCISYTIQCKIAPSWNRVDSYYLAGKNFFSNATKAMEFDVSVDDKCVYFKLYSRSLKLRSIQLENLHYLSSKQIAEFLADPAGFIDLSTLGSIWIHVLPSMKKGRVVSISKTIPPECPFKDFEQLRRHWKNMYGYFLPKKEDGVIYYQIKFPMPQSSPFTYPHFCVVSQPVQISEDKDKETTIKYFLAAVRKAIPSICGEELKFSKCNSQTILTPFTGRVQSPRMALPNIATSAKPSNHHDEFVSSAKVEFSAIYFKNVRNGASALQSPLLKVSQIHNASKANSSYSNERNDTVDIVRVASTSIETKIVPKGKQVGTEVRTIDAYFKAQKPHSSNVKMGEVINQNDVQKATPIQAVQTQKKVPAIQNALPAKGTNLLQNDDVDIVALAKENQLGNLKVKQLSGWLKKHAIPHNQHGKKEDLIYKILAHIRNTQTLHKYRV